MSPGPRATLLYAAVAPRLTLVLTKTVPVLDKWSGDASQLVAGLFFTALFVALTLGHNGCPHPNSSEHL